MKTVEAKDIGMAYQKYPKDIIRGSFDALSEQVGKDFLIWPSLELIIDLFIVIVDDAGSEVINISKDIKVTLPTEFLQKSANKKILIKLMIMSLHQLRLKMRP